MKPAQLKAELKFAAKKIYYPLVVEYIRANLEPEFHDLALASVIFYLPDQILSLPTKEERRQAIDSIPTDAYPAHSRDMVEAGVKILWKRR